MFQPGSTGSPASLETDTGLLGELHLVAVRHRKRLLRLGPELGIRLHCGAMTSTVEIVTFLYFHAEARQTGPPHRYPGHLCSERHGGSAAIGGLRTFR